jgi:hypothetical protein
MWENEGPDQVTRMGVRQAKLRDISGLLEFI